MTSGPLLIKIIRWNWRIVKSYLVLVTLGLLSAWQVILERLVYCIELLQEHSTAIVGEVTGSATLMFVRLNYGK